MSNNNPDWDRIVKKLEKSKPRPIDSLGAVLLGAVLFISLGGLVVMLTNMVIVSAWPNLTALNPGIGYRNACALFSLVWVYTTMRSSIAISVAKRGMDGQ